MKRCREQAIARAEADLVDLNEALVCVVLEQDFGLKQAAPVAPAQHIPLLERRHHHCLESIEHADIRMRFQFQEPLQDVSVATRSALDDRQHLVCHRLGRCDEGCQPPRASGALWHCPRRLP